MIKRIYRIYLKLELIFVTINSKLPTILRITKFGLITTCISFIIASCFSVVHAKDTNLGIWIDSQLPLTVKAANNIVSGKVVYYEQQGYYEIKGSLLDIYFLILYVWRDAFYRVLTIRDTTERVPPIDKNPTRYPLRR